VKRALVAFGSFCLGALVVLTGLELFLRQLPAERLGFRYAQGTFSPPREFRRDRKLNALGFRDAEVEPKEAGTRRVLLLGDSYVEGISVELPEKVGQRLEHYLNGGSEVAHDVVSLGRGGWGQIDQLSVLRHFGPELAPDVVVTLFLPLNDVRNNLPELQERVEEQVRAGEFERPGWADFDADDAALFFLEGSVLNRWVSYNLTVWRERRRPVEVPLDYTVYATEYDATWEQAWMRTKALLLETAKASRELGATYAIASASTPQGVLGAEEGLAALERRYPAMRSGTWDLDRPNRMLERFCAKHGIPFLSLEEEFRARTRSGAELHWPRDGHWNPAGHDLAGRLLAELVSEP
jgi:hypothetical protein